MNIGKPFRFFIPVLLAALTTGFVLGATRRVWLSVLVFIISFATSSWGVNTLDLWMRRKTRDQLWLWSGEGKAWLKTEEGQAWKQKTGYEE